MAKKNSPAKKVNAKAICSHPHPHSKGCFVLKGIILLILGLALWQGHLSLDLTIAIILVLAGIKFILAPLWFK